MLTDRDFYKSIIQIPNVQPSLSSTLLGKSSVTDYLIQEFETETLIDIFGYDLHSAFQNELEVKQGELLQTLKDTAAAKWDDLLNGKEYTVDGVKYKWRGLVFQDGTLKRSLIAYRVYCMYLFSNQKVLSATGMAVVDPDGANLASPIQEYVYCWNSFLKIVQGGRGNGIVGLYQFISDMNDEAADTYPNWYPKIFTAENQLGF